MSQTTALIEARGMVKRYADFALDHVSFSIEEGEIVGFVGKNGAGKSTTIKALLGIFALDEGEGRLLGVHLAPASDAQAAQVREQVGTVFDSVAMPGHLTLRDVERIHARAFSSWDASQFSHYVKQFQLPEKRAISKYSRGMGMKLSLACALSHHPRVLLLDEATAGLDPMVRDEVLDVLRAFVAQPAHAVLMSDHITSDLEKVADRVIGIDEGRIVFDLPREEITDVMGIARCRTADVERIAASDLVPRGHLRYLKRDLGIDVLIPDRFAFEESFPDIPCDRMSIDDYLLLILKGGVR